LYRPVPSSFAFAAAYDEGTGRYKGIQLRAPGLVVETTSLIVKPRVARAQITADEAAEEAAKKAAEEAAKAAINTGDGGSGATATPTATPTGTGTAPGGSKVIPQPPAPKKPNLFVGSVKLDGGRIGRDAGKIAEEVIQHLSTLPGAEVEVTLEIHVRVPGGVGDDVVRTVSENARTLKFTSVGFERE